MTTGRVDKNSTWNETICTPYFKVYTMIPPQLPTTTTTSTSSSTSLGNSIDSTMTPASSLLPTATKRGAFVLLEGIDRCGKTTQCTKLVERLVSIGIAATLMRFPDRTTSTGLIINNYLTQSQNQLDDHAIHLLFSANRWESASTIIQHLQNGTTVVCDRYVYSGVAFSASKIKSISKPIPSSTSTASDIDTNTTTTTTDEEVDVPVLDLEWCKAPDRGLPAPDCVLFLDVSPDVAEQRGGWGGERYEKRDIQQRVRKQFAILQQQEKDSIPWTIINADESIEHVSNTIWDIVQPTIQSCMYRPISKIWQEGYYEV